MKNKIFAFMILLLSCGCSLDIKLEDQFSDPDAITDVVTARSLLASAYESMPQYIYEMSLLSDDFVPSSKLDRDPYTQNLYRWQVTELSQLATSLWEGYYMTISYLNTLLERLPNIQTMTEEEVQEALRIQAQAEALKAWCYFDLLRLFAPRYEGNEDKNGIILKDEVEVGYLPRSTVRESAEEIRRLLAKAVQTDNEKDAVYWMSKKAIVYLQVELELYCGNYDQVIRLTEDIDQVFPSSTLEKAAYTALWSTNETGARIFGKYQTQLIYYDIVYNQYSEGDLLILNDEITYEETDIRKEWSELPFTMDGTREVRLFGKYNKMNRESVKSTYVNYMRTAEIYLARAEAMARTGNGAAVQLMNTYLETSGCQSLTGSETSGEELLQRILLERRKEFVGEGSRLFELKRLGNIELRRYNRYGEQTISRIKPDDYRWTLPIPISEIRYNDIPQNPGWENIIF